jgi:hypothetical protein
LYSTNSASSGKAEVAKLRRGKRTNGTLLAAGPLLELEAKLNERLEIYRDTTPDSDATKMLAFVKRELTSALQKARNVETFLSIAEVAETIRRPQSTITRMCRDRGESIGARKVAGVWQIDWPTFSASM